MHETIRFLKVIDLKKKRSQSSPGVNQNQTKLGRGLFPFAKVLQFNDCKFKQYPKWLTNRQDFVNFMYQKYENKLLSIPKICQKQLRASDEKYFISLYLQQIKIFSKLPSIINDLILSHLITKYYKNGDIIHHEQNNMPFIAIIFIGSVQYNKNKKNIIKNKNQLIMTQAFYKKYHPTIISKQQTVLLIINKQIYHLIQIYLKQQIQQRSRDQIGDMLKSDFFLELHLKDRKARSFYNMLKPQFYFIGQQICQAGQLATKFYIHFKGQIIQKNHIYIRQHNKWPLPNRRWQVRAVYNAFNNERILNPFNFFGDQQIINSLRYKSTFIAKTHVILFSITKEQFKQILSSQDYKRLKKYRNQHIQINYNQFQREIRNKMKSFQQRKKIIHRAIDTSFANKKQLQDKKIQLITSFENTMLKNVDEEIITDL